MKKLWRRLFGRVPAAEAPGAVAGHRLDSLDWYKVQGASPRAIEHLKSVAPFNLPESYLSLLRYSNGGEGPLAVQPHNFCLDSAEEVAETHLENAHRESFRDLFFIAGTGGCTRIAFDLRASEPYPLVAIDMCGGGVELALAIAPSFDAALELIGRESEEIDWDDP